MCRWLAYLGTEIVLEDVLIRPDHSLLDQSLIATQLRSRPRPLPQGTEPGGDPDPDPDPFRAAPTSGDGFGVAWAGRGGALGQYRQIGPAWDSQNLRHLASQIVSGCFLAHVRAAPGGTIAEQNCHPFVQEGWMFQHNGEIPDFPALKRELTFDVDPERYPSILGNTDTEVCFGLALTFGLAEDPVGALTRMVERVERSRSEHGIRAPFRATICASDGEQLIVLRWVSPDVDDEAAPSLFHVTGPTPLRTVDGRGDPLPELSQLVVSEPLEVRWSRDEWTEIPVRTIGVVRQGEEPVFASVEVGLM